MVRNAEKYYFPVRESISSILPVVDEFIVALGNSDEDDHTRHIIESIGSDKIRIIDRVWHEKDFINSKILAEETNFALSACTGDWCFYLQADEVVHEQDLDMIRKACEQYLTDKRVDGFLFRYLHFWGDYDHFLPFHGWYKNEIRIIRNHSGIYSLKDAQSFRKGNDEKLKVISLPAHIYHYGWVRPPFLMQSKKKEHDAMHHGKSKTETVYQSRPGDFDYGFLGNIPKYTGSHPGVMSDFMRRMNWQGALNYTKKIRPGRPLMKHEKRKYRVISFIENMFLGGRDLWGYRNWIKLKL